MAGCDPAGRAAGESRGRIARATRLLAALVLCGGLLVEPASAFSTQVNRATDALFAPGSAKLDDAARLALQTFADGTVPFRLETLIVTGHAAPDEPDARSLGARRAQAVRLHLMTLGFSARRIYTEPPGSPPPTAPPRVGQERSAEVEFVGMVKPADEPPADDRWMQWHRDITGRQPAVVFDDWAFLSPLEFRPLIADPNLRLRFTQHYERTLVLAQDDAALARLRADQAQAQAREKSAAARARLGTSSGPDAVAAVAPSSATLLAVAAVGTPFAQDSFAASSRGLDPRNAATRTLARDLWCWPSSRALLTPSTRERMQLAAILRTLDEADQHEWVRCTAQSGDAPALRLLASLGLRLDAPGAGGMTALQRTVLAADFSAVQALLSAGASPNAPDTQGRTALHHAAAASRGVMQPMSSSERATLWDLLVAAGADPSLVDNTGRRPSRDPGKR